MGALVPSRERCRSWHQPFLCHVLASWSFVLCPRWSEQAPTVPERGLGSITVLWRVSGASVGWACQTGRPAQREVWGQPGSCPNAKKERDRAQKPEPR